MTNMKVYVAVNPKIEECYTFHKLDEIKKFVVANVLDDIDAYMDDYIDYVKDTVTNNSLTSPQSLCDFICEEFETCLESSIAAFFGWYIYETVLQ